mgnify:CR=1 FL=1
MRSTSALTKMMPNNVPGPLPRLPFSLPPQTQKWTREYKQADRKAAEQRKQINIKREEKFKISEKQKGKTVLKYK